MVKLASLQHRGILMCNQTLPLTVIFIKGAIKGGCRRVQAGAGGCRRVQAGAGGCRRMREILRSSSARGHSQISDEALDVRVAEIKQFDPNCNSKALAGYLAAQGIEISRERIRQSLQRVDPIGVNAPTEEKHWHHLPGYLKPLLLELKKAAMRPLTKVEQHLQVLYPPLLWPGTHQDTTLLLCTAVLVPRLQKKYHFTKQRGTI
eukprot:gene16822-8286_t